MATNKQTTLTGRVRLDTSGLTKDVANAKGQIDGWAKHVARMRGNVVSGFAAHGGGIGGGLLNGVVSTKALAGLGLLSAGVAGVGAAAVVAGKAISAAWDLEPLVARLKATSDGSRALAEQMEILAQKALKPGLSLELLIEQVAAFQATGLSFDRSVKVVEELGNALAVTGATAPEIRNVTDALRDMLSGGVITDQKMDRLNETSAILSRVISDLYGTNQAIGLRGKGIGPAQLLNELVDALAKMDRAPDTALSKLGRLQASLRMLFATLGTLGTGPAGQLLDFANTIVGNLPEAFPQLKGLFGNFVKETEAERAKAREAAKAREEAMKAREEAMKARAEQAKLAEELRETDEARLKARTALGIADNILGPLREKHLVGVDEKDAARMAQAFHNLAAEIRNTYGDAEQLEQFLRNAVTLGDFRGMTFADKLLKELRRAEQFVNEYRDKINPFKAMQFTDEALVPLDIPTPINLDPKGIYGNIGSGRADHLPVPVVDSPFSPRVRMSRDGHRRRIGSPDGAAPDTSYFGIDAMRAWEKDPGTYGIPRRQRKKPDESSNSVEVRSAENGMGASAKIEGFLAQLVRNTEGLGKEKSRPVRSTSTKK